MNQPTTPDLSGYGAQVIEENGRFALTFWPYCTKCQSRLRQTPCAPSLPPEMQLCFGSISAPQTRRASTPASPNTLPTTPNGWNHSKRWQTLRKSWRPAPWRGPGSTSITKEVEYERSDQ